MQSRDRRPAFTLFDGAIGTELKRRGVDLAIDASVSAGDTANDYWAGKALLTAPHAVGAVHEDYLRAGADVITANTFRTNVRAVRRARVGIDFDAMTSRAMDLARRARAAVGRDARIAASIGPVESCYEAERVPDDATLRVEHRAMVEAAVASGAELLVVETMNTVREALVVADIAARRGAAFVVSFVLREFDGALPSGETLANAARAAASFGPEAVLVNCVAPRVIEAAMRTLGETLGGSRVGYGGQAHLAAPGDCPVEQYVQHARTWFADGARFIGGCCGTTPAYIAGIAGLRGGGSDVTTA
jgi:S-methylmethionine-dependent homocysteine/selenocysteine methylase